MLTISRARASDRIKERNIQKRGRRVSHLLALAETDNGIKHKKQQRVNRMLALAETDNGIKHKKQEQGIRQDR